MSLTAQQQEALVKIAAAAVSSEKQTGCPAELSAAQCIFESAWLSRCPGNNCFGIKSDAHGSGVQYILTHEYLDGTWEQMPLAFKTYTSLAECFSDHARLIQQGVYAKSWAQFQADGNLRDYIAGVAAHYATDPNYAAQITAEAFSSTVANALRAVEGVVIS